MLVNRTLQSLLLLVCLILCASFVPDEERSRLKTNEGKLIYISGDVSLTQGVLSFKDENGKWSKVGYQDVEWMTLGDKVYVRYFIDDKHKKRALMRLVAQTAEYRIWRKENIGADFIYIFDYHDQLIEENIKLYSTNDGAWKKNNREVIDKLNPYLKDCDEEILKTMESNHSNRFDILQGIGYIDCNGRTPYTDFLK